MTDREQKRILSENLNRLLAKHEKTQREVAEAIHVSPQTFNTWCQGIAFPRAGKIQSLADYFHVPKSQLIDEYSPDEDAPIDPRLVQIAKQMCRQDPVVLDVYDSEDRGKLVDYAELLYGAQDGRHLATAAHSSAGKVKPETMAQMEDDDLWK